MRTQTVFDADVKPYNLPTLGTPLFEQNIYVNWHLNIRRLWDGMFA